MMWKCHKCGKPVYFAERKKSLGYDWHPECLRCEECGKILNPGQHAEHKGIPYCNMPCYGVLFGPTLFGHGSQVEAHKSFGKSGKPTPSLDRNRLEAKLRLYNQYYDSKSWQLTSKERNGKLILEGVLRIYWGVRKTIRLQEDDDVIKALRIKQNKNNMELDDRAENDQKYQTLPLRIKLENPVIVVSKSEDGPSTSESGAEKCIEPEAETADTISITDDEDDTSLPKSRQSIDLSRVRIRKLTSSRSKVKLKRRCSINGHFYNRETSIFTPPYGSASNVWVTSLVNAPEVINLLLDKFRVENNPKDFALYVVWDSGETRQIQDLENPLLVRVLLGPHEDVAKVFIMDKNHKNEISNKVAQYLNLQEPELNAILRKFEEEEQREISQIQHKYRAMRRYIHSCLKSKSMPSCAQP